ncbi:MAG: DUF853 family protein [Erysipelotrichaceae bacterium]|nr:DUF853 family protein [Erysipelotrichaceae bacterium]
MSQSVELIIGQSDKKIILHTKMANRHGLIAGATGTGKTISLKVLAEQFSEQGVPVFLADVKGDLASLAEKGVENPKLMDRINQLGLTPFEFKEFPVRLWDVFGELGHPLRTTVSEMGPLLLARILELNDTQAGVLNIVFRVADEQGLLLIDLKDLRAMVQYVGDHADEYTTQYGNVSKPSIGAIQRSLLTLEDQGGTSFFAEPAFEILDLMKVDSYGRGTVNVLASENKILIDEAPLFDIQKFIKDENIKSLQSASKQKTVSVKSAPSTGKKTIQPVAKKAAPAKPAEVEEEGC